MIKLLWSSRREIGARTLRLTIVLDIFMALGCLATISSIVALVEPKSDGPRSYDISVLFGIRDKSIMLVVGYELYRCFMDASGVDGTVVSLMNVRFNPWTTTVVG